MVGEIKKTQNKVINNDRSKINEEWDNYFGIKNQRNQTISFTSKDKKGKLPEILNVSIDNKSYYFPIECILKYIPPILPPFDLFNFFWRNENNIENHLNCSFSHLFQFTNHLNHLKSIPAHSLGDCKNFINKNFIDHQTPSTQHPTSSSNSFNTHNSFTNPNDSNSSHSNASNSTTDKSMILSPPSSNNTSNPPDFHSIPPPVSDNSFKPGTFSSFIFFSFTFQNIYFGLQKGFCTFGDLLIFNSNRTKSRKPVCIQTSI